MDRRSPEAEAYRRLYKAPRWQALRKGQLATSPLCEMCLEDGHTTPATICNHIDKDAKATEAGFFAGPFNSLCKTHHDATQQSNERTGRIKGCDVDGWPRDAGHHWRMK